MQLKAPIYTPVQAAQTFRGECKLKLQIAPAHCRMQCKRGTGILMMWTLQQTRRHSQDTRDQCNCTMGTRAIRTCVLHSGGPQMKQIWFFEFESRQWSCKHTTGGKDNWTFGHAIRRSRYMYAYGTRHAVHTEESLAEVMPSCQVPAVTLIGSFYH